MINTDTLFKSQRFNLKLLNNFSDENTKTQFPYYQFSFFHDEVNKKEMISFYYNYLYLNYIYCLINYCNFQYRWIEINNNILIQENTEKDFKLQKNPFIQQSVNDKTLLGRDILTNGLYTPFYFFEIENNLICCGGKHRIFSLKQLPKEELENKQFLSIIFPIEYNSKAKWKEMKSLFNHNVIVGFIEDRTFYLSFTREIAVFYENFKALSENIGSYIFNYKKEILPNKIFNDKNLFEIFIKTKDFYGIY